MTNINLLGLKLSERASLPTSIGMELSTPLDSQGLQLAQAFAKSPTAKLMDEFRNSPGAQLAEQYGWGKPSASCWPQEIAEVLSAHQSTFELYKDLLGSTATKQALQIEASSAIRSARDMLSSTAFASPRSIGDQFGFIGKQFNIFDSYKQRLPSLFDVHSFHDIAGQHLITKSNNSFLSISPDILRPLTPPRDVDQDERFERLTSAVLVQTEEIVGEIVELRQEVREVKQAATRDSSRRRRQATKHNREGRELDC